MYKQKSGKQKGQTLVEVLIYIAIFGTVATSLIGIVWNVTKIHSYQLANNEVDSNLSYAMNLINDKIRSASSVESATGSTLVLRMPNNITTTFSVTDGVLYLKEGSADPVAVISDRVAVSSLNFEKIDMTGAKGGARVSMTLTYVPKEGTSSEVQKTLISAITRSATAISFSEDIVPGQNNSYSVGSSSLNWKNGFFSGDLTVNGTLKGTTLCIGTDCKTAWGQVSGVTGSGTTNYVTKWASTGTLGNSVIYDNGTSVGIGTTSPSTPLHIYSTASNPALITLQHSGGTSSIGAYGEGVRVADGDAAYFFDNGAVNIGNSGHSQPVIVRGSQLDVDEELVVSGTGNSSFVGNVGIGTTSPGAILHIGTSTSGNQKLLQIGEPGLVGTYGLVLRGDSADGVFKFYGLNNSVETTNPILSMNRNNGNVGIGTTAPGAKLDLSGNVNIRVNNYAAFGSQYSSATTVIGNNVGADTASVNQMVNLITHASYAGSAIQLIGSDGITFHTKSGAATAGAAYSSPRMKILADGNVGIGTTTPGGKLTVIVPSNEDWPTLGTASGSFRLLGSSNLFGLYAGIKDSSGGAWFQAMRSDTATAYNLALQPVGGNVGIGTTTPGAKLDVAGEIRGTVFKDRDNTSYYLDPGAASYFSSATARNWYVDANGVPTNNLGNPTLPEMALFQEEFNNKLEFYDISKFTFETYDGSTWTDVTSSISDTDKKKLVGGDASANIVIPNGVVKYRISIRNKGTYVYLNALYSYLATSGHNTQIQIWKKRDDGDWTQHTTSTATVSSWPGHVYLPFAAIPWSVSATTGHYNDVRIEFTPTWSGSYPSNNIVLYKLQLWGGYPAAKRTIYSVDENQGVYFDTNTLAIDAANNRIGIATTTPAYTLDVNGNARVTGTLSATTFSGAWAGTVPAANVSAGDFGSSVGGGNFTFPASVGIGTTSPAKALHIINTGTQMRVGYDTNNYYEMQVDSSGNVYHRPTSGLSYYNTTGKNNVFFVYNYTDGSSSYARYYGDSFSLIKQGTTTVVISNNGNSYLNGGNVGIGTTSPGYPLDIQSASGAIYLLRLKDLGTGGNNYTVMRIEQADTAAIGMWGLGGQNAGNTGLRNTMYMGTQNAYDVKFVTTDTPRLTILSGGNVGIGTTTPEAKLNISGLGNGASGLLYVNSTSTSARGTLARVGYYSYWNMDGTGNTFWNWGARYDGEANQWVRAYTSADNYLPYIKYGVSGTIGIGGAVSNLTTDTNPTMSDKFVFNVSNGALTLNGSGNTTIAGSVGIGTTNPSLAKLQIEAGNGVVGQYINGGTTVGTDLLKLRANAATQRLILEGTGGTVQTFLEAGGSIGLFGTVTNHDFRIRTNYVDRMTFDTSGNVGIGTTSPGAKLDVSNTADEILRLTRDTATYPTKFKVGTDSAFIVNSNNSDVLTLKSGNVGIGITSPTSTLTVAGTVESTTGGFKFPDGTTQTTAAGTSLWVASGNDIYNSNSANVGIGTSSPSEKLHLQSSSGNIALKLTTQALVGAGSSTPGGPNSPSAATSDSANGGTVTWSGPTSVYTSNNTYATATGNSEAMTYYLKATGFGFSLPSNVKIEGITVEAEMKKSSSSAILTAYTNIIRGGTVNPASYTASVPYTEGYVAFGGATSLWSETNWLPADVNASNFGVALSVMFDPSISNTVSVDHIRITVHYSTPTLDYGDWTLKFVTSTAALSIQSSFSGGKVGIGTTDPTRPFWVNGSAGGTTAWYSSSDARLKKNVSTIENALEKVEQLRGVYFEWKDASTHVEGQQIGLIAQEAKDIVPQVVSQDGEYYSIQYGPIAALLIEATKEQQKQIDELKTVASQDNFVEKVKKAIVSLESWLETQVIKVKALIADEISAKKVRVEQLEMVDKTTGEVYCTWIENGEWTKTKGACE